MTPEEKARREAQKRQQLQAMMHVINPPILREPSATTGCTHCGFALAPIQDGPRRFCAAPCQHAYQVAQRLQGPPKPTQADLTTQTIADAWFKAVSLRNAQQGVTWGKMPFELFDSAKEPKP